MMSKLRLRWRNIWQKQCKLPFILKQESLFFEHKQRCKKKLEGFNKETSEKNLGLFSKHS